MKLRKPGPIFWIVVLTAAYVLLTVCASAAELDCETRPSWCAPGYACTPISCLTELRVQLEEARLDALYSKRAARRLHFDLTCGPGAATVVTQEWDLKGYPTPGACVVGLAVRLGR